MGYIQVMLYSLLSHALACRKGTARIQLRCRAEAATVLNVGLGCLCRCLVIWFSVAGGPMLSQTCCREARQRGPSQGSHSYECGARKCNLDPKVGRIWPGWDPKGQDGARISVFAERDDMVQKSSRPWVVALARIRCGADVQLPRAGALLPHRARFRLVPLLCLPPGMGTR